MQGGGRKYWGMHDPGTTGNWMCQPAWGGAVDVGYCFGERAELDIREKWLLSLHNPHFLLTQPIQLVHQPIDYPSVFFTFTHPQNLFIYFDEDKRNMMIENEENIGTQSIMELPTGNNRLLEGATTGKQELMIIDDIQSLIHTIRGIQVMLDEDLADLYGVEVRVLNQSVKRNIDRFPKEFNFQLSTEENEVIKSQIVTLKSGRGKHRKYLPYAFTEQGVAMLAGVLRSETAVKMSIQIINSFVAMRRFIASNAQIFLRLDTLELRQLETNKKMDIGAMEMLAKLEEQMSGVAGA